MGETTHHEQVSFEACRRLHQCGPNILCVVGNSFKARRDIAMV
jgi:hypothetical protein